ncbi:Nicotinamidase-related amidase [Kaistia soli DSM 19436]|uniref:Nicotinamidase-related amidase n=1 Tax=Kaistia soli DSM 19436 TaxID=1122133 RepID=A0A1M5ID76_9HYPH|nr:isochorismatase family cysteine hydrolase [Kaistia soli]SHG25723.1 Nicotinamidase-related amidase [Kaistia soli DSM 19436]
MTTNTRRPDAPADGTVLQGTSPAQGWLVGRDHVDMSRPPRPYRPAVFAAEPQSVTIDAGKTALLIVDMQNDFCTVGGWLSSRGIDITPNRAPIAPLQRMIKACRAAAVPVVWVNWGVRKDLLNIFPSLRHAHSPRGDEPGLAEPVPGTRSEVIAKGSWGAEVVDEINPGTADIQITKHRFSAFWDCETDSVLRNLGVTTLMIAGVNMDQCVMTTLEDASFLGYDVVLIEDCTATTSPRFCVEAVLYNVKLLFGFVTRSEAVIEALSQGATL